MADLAAANAALINANLAAAEATPANPPLMIDDASNSTYCALIFFSTNERYVMSILLRKSFIFFSSSENISSNADPIPSVSVLASSIVSFFCFSMRAFFLLYDSSMIEFSFSACSCIMALVVMALSAYSCAFSLRKVWYRSNLA